MAAGLSRRWKFLGDASYSIYLTHLAPIVVFRKIWTMDHLPTEGLANALIFIALNMALATLCASVTYLYFEKPMLDYLRQRLGLRRQRPDLIAEPRNVIGVPYRGVRRYYTRGGLSGAASALPI
jgi:peptidoglycan/LPS O-acetylase OafA/YrhL